MDGEALQALIYKGHKRAAEHAGRVYSHYRAESPISPLEAGNLLGEISCLFAAEKRFEVPAKYKDAVRYLYADGRELQQRDILVGPYGTFYVGDMQPNLPMQAVRCNDSVSINRPIYQYGSQIEVIDGDPIVSACPAFRQIKKVDQKPVPASFGATSASTPVGEWFLYIPVDGDLLKQQDIVIDATGRRYTISIIDHTEIGTVLVIRQADTEGEA
jgi:hypothetical protein